MINYKISIGNETVTAGTVESSDSTYSFDYEFNRDDDNEYTIEMWDSDDEENSIQSLKYKPSESDIASQIPEGCEPEPSECEYDENDYRIIFYPFIRDYYKTKYDIYNETYALYLDRFVFSIRNKCGKSVAIKDMSFANITLYEMTTPTPNFDPVYNKDHYYKLLRKKYNDGNYNFELNRPLFNDSNDSDEVDLFVNNGDFDIANLCDNDGTIKNKTNVYSITADGLPLTYPKTTGKCSVGHTLVDDLKEKTKYEEYNHELVVDFSIVPRCANDYYTLIAPDTVEYYKKIEEKNLVEVKDCENDERTYKNTRYVDDLISSVIKLGHPLYTTVDPYIIIYGFDKLDIDRIIILQHPITSSNNKSSYGEVTNFINEEGKFINEEKLQHVYRINYDADFKYNLKGRNRFANGDVDTRVGVQSEKDFEMSFTDVDAFGERFAYINIGFVNEGATFNGSNHDFQQFDAYYSYFRRGLAANKVINTLKLLCSNYFDENNMDIPNGGYTSILYAYGISSKNEVYRPGGTLVTSASNDYDTISVNLPDVLKAHFDDKGELRCSIKMIFNQELEKGSTLFTDELFKKINREQYYTVSEKFEEFNFESGKVDDNLWWNKMGYPHYWRRIKDEKEYVRQIGPTENGGFFSTTTGHMTILKDGLSTEGNTTNLNNFFNFLLGAYVWTADSLVSGVYIYDNVNSYMSVTKRAKYNLNYLLLNAHDYINRNMPSDSDKELIQYYIDNSNGDVTRDNITGDYYITNWYFPDEIKALLKK